MPQFSKGPWVVKGGIVVSADNYTICTPSTHSTRYEANTKLICAATTMYATLAQIERELRSKGQSDLADAAKAAMQAASTD